MRHEELWFDDGNVFFVSRNLRFKLHRGVVAKCSSVFRDMFQFGDASAGDSIDSCPVPLPILRSILCYSLRCCITVRDIHFLDPYTSCSSNVYAESLFFHSNMMFSTFRPKLSVVFVCATQLSTLESWDRRYPRSLSAVEGGYPSIGTEDTLQRSNQPPWKKNQLEW
ncbi:hypothetical protein PHLGIDRAFT_341543 [Phlebiopsis gigantea 11061_1 CR5-6]|uniref:BTB domain-containing protein n=1 Tax=Phlebiopsis gigantea (strain 11061_1 CR5-6) TaxID=745531 RepID=A0A0C3NAW5_PHLG1|nr:hypothetical protein PHLGIDRAFT_341543 [Phlebiopsis gigantea 11061_1 CR5-6]